LLLIGILTLGFMARAVTVKSPVFDFHSWRQADTASIARNFVREDFNPLHPQVDSRGDRAVGYVETGLELHAVLTATLATVVGFSVPLARMVSVLSFPISALLLFVFLRDRYGQAAAVTGTAIYAVGLPLTMYVDRAILNEPLLALLTIASFRAAQLYLRDRRAAALVGLFAAMALIAIVKPTYLIAGAFVAGLFVERHGARGLLRWELWAVGATAAGAGVAWFQHARTLHAVTGLSFGLTDKLFDAELLFSGAFVSKIVTRLVKDVLGPIGMAGVIYGVVVGRRSGRWAEVFGLAAFLVYLGVVTTGNFSHNYYQLPVVPPAICAMALGLTTAVERIGQRRGWASDRIAAGLAAVVWLAALATFIRAASAHSWYEVAYDRVHICDELVRAVPPTQRLAFLHYGSPDLLFCTDRKGWILQDYEVEPRRLNELLDRNAVIVVETRFAETVRLLDQLATPMTTTPAFVAYGRRR
jgi:hypothetical protein